MDLYGLFLGSFLASTLLPGGSEALLAVLYLQSQQATPLLWLVASLGNTLGGMFSFALGWWLRTRFVGKGADNPRHRRARAWLRRWGSPALSLSWLPLIGDPLCVVAGWLRLPWLAALFWIFLGKALRYAALLAGLRSAVVG